MACNEDEAEAVVADGLVEVLLDASGSVRAEKHVLQLPVLAISRFTLR
jgi:hypothetical protein